MQARKFMDIADAKDVREICFVACALVWEILLAVQCSAVQCCASDILCYAVHILCYVRGLPSGDAVLVHGRS